MRITAVLVSCIVSISAAAGAQETPAKSSPAKDDDRKQITVSGCLQAAAQPNQFMLMAMADALAKGVAVSVSGAVPNVTYQLSGGSNLGAHVGHQVEITGRTSGRPMKAGVTGEQVDRERVPGKPDPKVETKEKATIELRDLHVESLKMVSTSCAAAK